MKTKICLGSILFAGGVFLSTNAFSQAGPQVIDTNATIINPQYVVAIIAGVLITFGLQLVLTNLSIALGITAIGNIENTNRENLKEREREKENIIENRKEREPEVRKKSDTPMGVKFMTGAGAWALVTQAISLFLGCMLAVKLSLVADNGIAFSLGLVIWSIYFMTMLYIESRAAGALLSTVFGDAFNAVKAGLSSVGSMFTKSETEKTKDIIHGIRSEVDKAADDYDLDEKFNELIERAKPTPFDSNEFKKELADLLNGLKIEQRESRFPREKELFLKVAKRQPDFSNMDITNLEKIFEGALATIGLASVSKQFGLGKKASEYVQDQFMPKIKDELEHYILDKQTPDANPEVVRAEIDEIFSHDLNIGNFIRKEGDVFDKNNVCTVVASQKGVSKEEAMEVANKVESALNSILSKANIQEMATSKAKDIKEQITNTISEKHDEMMDNLENRFENLFNRINRPELDYSMLKNEFEIMMNHPSLAPEIMRRKINQMDSETAKGIITATGRFNKTEAENIVRKFEETRSSINNKLAEVQSEINLKTEQAKEFALEKVENTRKTAMVAAWWLLGTLVLAAIAAGLGGMAGL